MTTENNSERTKEYLAMLEAKYAAENLETEIEKLQDQYRTLRDHYKELKAEYYEKYQEA